MPLSLREGANSQTQIFVEVVKFGKNGNIKRKVCGGGILLGLKFETQKSKLWKFSTMLEQYELL